MMLSNQQTVVNRGSVSQLSVASKQVDLGKSIKHEVVKTKEYVQF